LIETKRLAEYKKRHYSWPPADSEYKPDTPGWQALMEERFAQVAEIDIGPGERYEGYMQTVSAALIAPNFTEYGFGLARCPDDLIQTLRKGIRDGLKDEEDERDEEPYDEAIDAPNLPWFIHSERFGTGSRLQIFAHGFLNGRFIFFYFLFFSRSYRTRPNRSRRTGNATLCRRMVRNSTQTIRSIRISIIS
jgi:hypothetical protein